jgi:hypothetical protein
MNSCSQTGCRNIDLKPYKLAFRHQYSILCGDCAASLVRMGLGLTAVERRETDLDVAIERRQFRPAWLERLTAIDLTGRVKDVA